MKDKYLGPLLLTLAAIIWGSAFVVMKSTINFLPANTLLFVRFTLATIFMVIIFFKYLKQIKNSDFIKGAIVGGCLFMGFSVQTIGLATTTPGKSAFLTTVYCVLVPFLVWAFHRHKPDGYNFIAAIICFIGIGMVSIESDLTINIGDLLTLLSGVFFAFHIIFIKKYTKEVDPIILTMLQFGFVAFFSLICSLVFEDIGVIMDIKIDIIFQIFYLAFFATTVALLFQNIGQKLISECNASIILSLESVFGIFFSVLFYGEQLTYQIIFGFILIFIAIIVSETKLSFLKIKKGELIYEEDIS